MTTTEIAALRKAADQGDVAAQYYLGICYGHNLEMAAKCYNKAAELGYRDAMYQLGLCYQFGKGVKKDPEMAVLWFNEAADQRHSEAMCQLGLCYQFGKGVKKDRKMAAKCYNKAYHKGLAEAMNQLELCHEEIYERGLRNEVDGDFKAAVESYKTAAGKGHPAAMYKLGSCYLLGKGCKKDVKMAAEWYAKAAHKGYPHAQEMLDRCHKEKYQLGHNYGHGERSVCGNAKGRCAVRHLPHTYGVVKERPYIILNGCVELLASNYYPYNGDRQTLDDEDIRGIGHFAREHGRFGSYPLTPDDME